MQPRTTVETLTALEDRLSRFDRVFFSRFGDGDFWHMAQRNTREQQASPELAKELEEAFNIVDDNYMIGICVNHPTEPGMRPGKFEVFSNNSWLEEVAKSKDHHNRKSFYSYVPFHYMMSLYPEKLRGFLDKYIVDKKKMFIGGIEKEHVEKLFGKINYHVEAPFDFAYDTIDEWWKGVEDNVNNVDLVIPCVGFSGRVANKRLWQAGHDVWSIDFGSIVDAAAGRTTRGWMTMTPTANVHKCLLKV